MIAITFAVPYFYALDYIDYSTVKKDYIDC